MKYVGCFSIVVLLFGFIFLSGWKEQLVHRKAELSRCLGNISVLNGAVEIYLMDHPNGLKEVEKNYENIFLRGKFSDLKNVPQCGVGRRKLTDFVSYSFKDGKWICPRHGTPEAIKKEMEENEAKQKFLPGFILIPHFP